MPGEQTGHLTEEHQNRIWFQFRWVFYTEFRGDGPNGEGSGGRMLSGYTYKCPDNKCCALASAVQMLLEQQYSLDSLQRGTYLQELAYLRNPTNPDPRTSREPSRTDDSDVQLITLGYEKEGCSSYNGCWDLLALEVQDKPNREVSTATFHSSTSSIACP